MENRDVSHRILNKSPLEGLRICLVAGTLGRGGAERQLYYIVKTLRDNHARVSLLTLTQGEYWEEPIRALGVPIHFVGDSSSRMARLVQIAKTVGRLRSEIVQSQHFFTNVYVAVSGRLYGRPSIGAVRSNGITELRETGALLGRLSMALPTVVAANSRAAIQGLVQRGWRTGRFFYLPNGIDMEHFRPGLGWSTRPYTILGMGRLVPEKRFDRLIRVAQRAAARVKQPVRVWIAGDGPDCGKLRELIKQVNEPGLEISLRGAVSDPLPLYQESDVFLLTSDHEGTPNVVMEAVACGLPVVGTKVGDVPELVKDGFSGYLFESADESGMADALVRLVDPGLRASLGANGRVHLRDGHAVERLAGLLLRLYDQARS